MIPGMVCMFATDTVDVNKGWLECDGRAVSRKHWPDLFRAIGTIHGGDGVDEFHLPDLRGAFVRGRDGGAGIDPDADSRGHAAPGNPNPGNSGDNVGSRQGHALMAHRHRVGPLPVGHTVNGNGSRHRIDSDDGPSWSNYEAWQYAEADKDTMARETRPVNVGVVFAIFAGHYAP